MSELNYKDMRIVSHKDYEDIVRQNKELWETMKMIKEGHFSEMDSLKIAVEVMGQRWFSSAMERGFYPEFPTFESSSRHQENDQFGDANDMIKEVGDE